MNETTKNILITIIFATIFIGIFLINILISDNQISKDERRRLNQFPQISIKTILNGNFMNQFEDYAVDQFIFRDTFRQIKTFISFDIFKHKDNHGLFTLDGYIFNTLYPLNELGVISATNSINNIINLYLNDNPNIYFSIIPDKNYYLENTNHLTIDYDKIEEILLNNIIKGKYINIFNDLNLKSYYRTDIHWRQEMLSNVINKISREMNINLNHQNNNYIIKSIDNFYGSYFGQLGQSILPDKLNYLTNQTIEEVVVTYNGNEKGSIYNTNAIKEIDMYNIFLSGAKPIIQIENTNANNNRELIMFRDSFSSSLAPLLIPAYQKITLIDLRYISPNIISNLQTFNNNQDILFLYSVNILNQGGLLR